MRLYRGTQTQNPERSVRGSQSYTDSLPIAIIWSARPGDSWHGIPTQLLKTSTVHAADLDCKKVLDLREFGTYASLGTVLKKLKYGTDEGPSIEEASKVYFYLHNRLTGRAKGGDFKYKVFDEDGDEMTDADVPFSFRNPETPIRWHGYPEFEYEPSIATASRLIADTFVFADAPAIQRAAITQGYDCIAYEDVFAGGESASEAVLGVDLEEAVEGVDYSEDIEGDYVPMHVTFRPLRPELIKPVWSKRSEVVLRWWRMHR